MKDLLLNELNLVYRCEVGFNKFFRTNKSDLENHDCWIMLHLH